MGFGYAEESLTIDLDTQDVEALFKILVQKELPMLPPHIEGMDGSCYTLNISNGLNSITYEWWVDIPPRFEVLEEIRDTLFRWAEIDLNELLEGEEAD